MISGDPFSPAGGNIFGHYLWNEIDLQVQTAEQARHGISPATLDLQQAINKVGSDVVFMLYCLSLHLGIIKYFGYFSRLF